jgi:hypothetical protein
MAPKSEWVRVGGENVDTFSFDAVNRLRIQALTRMISKMEGQQGCPK